MSASESGCAHGKGGESPSSCASGPAEHGPRYSGGIARTAALLGGFALVSRVLGLLRDMSMAWLVGGGAAADALVAAMRLPHVLRRMLGEGSLSMTLTGKPCASGAYGRITRHTVEGERSRSMRLLARALAVRLGLVLTLLTVLGAGGAPPAD